MTEPSEKRVTVTLALIFIGFMLVGIAMFTNGWMLWATGALTIRFAMWLGED